MKKIIRQYVTSFDKEQIYVEIRKNAKLPEKFFIITHGMGGDSNSTTPIANALLKLFPSVACITYDLRGHGKSSSHFSPDTTSLEDCGAKDLQSLCLKLAVKKPIFIGHSLGGIFIQKYLELDLKPTPRHSFISCSPSKSPNLSIKRNFWYKLLQQLSQGYSESHVKRSVQKFLNYRNTNDLNLSRLFSDLKHTGRLKLPLLYFSVLGWKVHDQNKVYGPHTSLIYGNKDLFVRNRPDPVLIGHTGVNITELNSNHHQVLLKSPKKIARLVFRQLAQSENTGSVDKQTPIFSIIIPTLNEAKYVPILLDNLQKQLFQSFETIVIDGGSSDDTISLVKAFTKIKPLVIHSDRKNVGWQRNLGARKAKGNWLVFLDADIQLPVDFTLNLIKQLHNNPECDSFTTFCNPDSSSGQDRTINKLGNLAILLASLSSKPFTYGSCTGVTSAVFNDIGGFNPDLKISEDHDLVRRIVNKHYKFKVFTHPEVIFSFRRFRKEGRLKMMRKLAKISLTELTRVLAFDERDYPMLGGDYYHDVSDQHQKKLLIDKFNMLSYSQRHQISEILNKIKNVMR